MKETRAITVTAHVRHRPIHEYSYTCPDCGKPATAKTFIGSFARVRCEHCADERRRMLDRERKRRKRAEVSASLKNGQDKPPTPAPDLLSIGAAWRPGYTP